MSTPKSLDDQMMSLSHHDWTVLQSAWARGWSWWIARHFNPKTGKLTKKWVLSLPGISAPPFTTKTSAYDEATRAVCAESRRRTTIEN